MSRETGFTLIELMVVLAVIGILMAIAYPQYMDHLTRSRITQATSQLALKRAQMEQYYQDNHTFTDVGSTTPAACAASSTDYFSFACTVKTAAAYTIEATGKGVMSGFSYTVDQDNVMTSTGPWGNSSSCWITSKGGGC